MINYEIKIKNKRTKRFNNFICLNEYVIFVIVVVAVYVNTNYKAQAQQRELEKIQQTYQKEDINDIYLEHKQ